MVELRRKYKRMLESYVPFSTDVERMGVHRAPLLTFAAREEAATAYRQIWEDIAKKIRTKV
jgi:chromosome partitioning protein